MYDNVGECRRQCKRLACYPGTGVEPGSVVSRGGSAARGDQEHIGCPLPRPTRQLRATQLGPCEITNVWPPGVDPVPTAYSVPCRDDVSQAERALLGDWLDHIAESQRVSG
jgi:hypothetical protein